MNDPRCWREVLIRGGITTIIVAVAAIFLDADPWVWVIPPAVASITILKWAVRPEDVDDAADNAAYGAADDTPRISDLL
jgi:hypothetical protein